MTLADIYMGVKALRFSNAFSFVYFSVRHNITEEVAEMFGQLFSCQPRRRCMIAVKSLMRRAECFYCVPLFNHFRTLIDLFT
jgi:hypothetical protein